MAYTPIAITESATALAFPPTAIAWVDDVWLGSLIKEFDLIWSAEVDTGVSSARLYGLRLLSLVVNDATVTSAGATDLVTLNAHGLKTGDGPVFFTNAGGLLSTPLVAGVGYYVIRTGANDFKLATSRRNAFAGTFIDLGSDGTGTTTISDSTDTKRVKFDSYGLLGDNADGSLSLTADGFAYTEPFRHRANTVGYAVSATLSAANAQRVYVSPVVLK